MTRRPTFLARHPVVSYFALAFAISWCGFSVVAGASGIPGTTDEIERLMGVALGVGIAGPIAASVLLTRLIAGRAGLRELRSRLLRWRVGVPWYAVGLLTIPLVAAATLLPLSLLSADLRPGIVTTDGSKAALLVAGVAVGLVVGFCEEVGWTGFAIPRLRLRHDLLATGLIVGLLWGVWHLPLFLWASGDASGRFVWSAFLLSAFFCMVILPACRVLIVWLNDHTQSLLLAILMHATIDVVSLVLMPRDAAAGPHLAWYAVFAAALWGAAAVAVVADRQRTRQRPRKTSDRLVHGAPGPSPA